MDSESIQDLFQEIGRVRTRRMFGGHGIYFGERIFGLEIGGQIYLKADAITQPEFERAGSRPFTYEREDGRAIAMSYWLLPGGAVDDPSEAARWARLALEAGSRAAEPKKKTPARRKS
jgi:DNA transformation protein